MIASAILNYFDAGYSGVLLEIGAAFPEMGSPVSSFRKIGWTVISVEPNPVFCDEFRALELPILQYAAYSEDLGETKFNISSNGLSYSSLDLPKKTGTDMTDIKGEFSKGTALSCNLSKNFNWKFFPKNGGKKTIKVIALTLNTILQRHYPLLNKIDAMIVDVEGHEVEVMRGINLEKYSPKVIVIENIRSDTDYRDYMESKGYSLNGRIDIDDFYTKIKTNGTAK